MKINKIITNIIYFLGFFALFFILHQASIVNTIYPFAGVMLFALAWVDQKVHLLVPAFLLSSLACGFDFYELICSLCISFFLLLPYYIHLCLHKKMKKYELVIYAFLSNIAEVIITILTYGNIVALILQIFTSMTFLFMCMQVFEGILRRRFSVRVTNLEMIFLMVILVAIFSGLSNFDFNEFSLFKMISVIVILSCCLSTNISLLFFTTSAISIGYLVATCNTIYFAPLLLIALLSIAVKPLGKYVVSISAIGIDMLCGFCFNIYYEYSIYSIIPILVASIIIIIMPKQYFDALKKIFDNSVKSLAVKDVIKRNNELVFRQVNNLSNAFFDIEKNYREMIKYGFDEVQIKKVMLEELKGNLCNLCDERMNCYRVMAVKTEKAIFDLFDIAFKKGKVNLLDLQPHLTSHCKNVPALITAINGVVNNQKKYLTLQNNVDNSKLVIADQMRGVANVLKNLSKNVVKDVSFNSHLEEEIINKLSYYNVLCSDAIVYGTNINSLEVSLVVQDVGKKNLIINDVISSVCGTRMQINDIYSSNIPSFNVVNLKNTPKLDCIFGVKQVAKSGQNVCGDSYSVERLSSDKFMFSICDGMGHGERAKETSENAISLIESFYRAGFDSDSIVTSANKLVAINSFENFTAMDICIIDLKSGFSDFIKMASPTTFIYNTNEITEIKGASLPFGAIVNFLPASEKLVVSANDYIIMVSDGVVNSFKNEGTFKRVISNITTSNPQEMADRIINHALLQTDNYSIDDLTCIVIKIFEA